MTTIPTPDDEPDKPGWFWPPFREGWTYVGATYAGHSDYSTDWNRRTPTGGWLDDTGDPVLASADGTVAEVDKSNGLVMLNHGGLWRTESRHMTDILVKVDDKVQRGDRIGSIGNVAGDGRSFGAHLHVVHWKRAKTGDPFVRTKMRFLGKDVGPSVADSDTRPAGWNPPDPAMVEGPAPRATWEGAYREAARRLVKAEQARDEAKARLTLTEGERDDARARLVPLTEQAARLDAALARSLADLSAATVALAECRAQPPGDCTAQDARLAAYDAWVAGRPQ